jgi:hypothetical protein
MVVNIRVIRADGGRMTFGFAMLARCSSSRCWFGVLSSITFGLALAARRAVAAVGRGEPRAARLVVNTRVIRPG